MTAEHININAAMNIFYGQRQLVAENSLFFCGGSTSAKAEQQPLPMQPKTFLTAESNTPHGCQILC